MKEHLGTGYRDEARNTDLVNRRKLTVRLMQWREDSGLDMVLAFA